MQRVKPAPGQESVWDYPRPPRLEPSRQHIVVEFAREIVADTHRALRMLETSHPPVYYLPPADVRADVLIPSRLQTYCEFKGTAAYLSLQVNGKISENAAWYYPLPTARYALIKDHIAFYPSRVDACFVDDERVRAQEGDFYGGWITTNIVGPFKGGPGTKGW